MEFQSCFDIIGPIMVGPSSSHTAGVVSIGNFTQELLGGIPEEVDIIFYNSFATTYQGHGTNKALLGGLLGMDTADTRIKHAIEMSEQHGLHYQLHFENRCPYYDHPNTVVVKAKRGEYLVKVGGASLGGGLSKIFIINDKFFDIRLSTNDDISKLIARYHQDMENALKGGV